MSMGVKSNNNSSTYGTSKTYSGRKTRDCKQMEEHLISEQECVVGLLSMVGFSSETKNIGLITAV